MAKKTNKRSTKTTYIRNGKKIALAMKHGRPGEYDPRIHDKLAYNYLMLGATHEECALRLEIDITTYYKWQVENKSFSKAIFDATTGADELVARSLFHRATGMTYSESVVKVNGDGSGNNKKITKESVTTSNKHLPPDVRAMEIWLRNRQRKRWTQVPMDEVVPPPPVVINNNSIDISKLTDTDLRNLIAIINKGN